MPQITAHNKIVLRGDFGTHDEGILGAPSTPGMNLVMTAATETQKRHTYSPGATLAGGTAAGGAASPIKVHREDSLQGKTVDDAQAAGDNARFFVPVKGNIIQVRVASGQTVAKGNQGWAIGTGLWNAGAASINAVGEFLEGSGGVALTADTLMRFRVY